MSTCSVRGSNLPAVKALRIVLQVRSIALREVTIFARGRFSLILSFFYQKSTILNQPRSVLTFQVHSPAHLQALTLFSTTPHFHSLAGTFLCRRQSDFPADGQNRPL